jgi:hypothetical protein
MISSLKIPYAMRNTSTRTARKADFSGTSQKEASGSPTTFRSSISYADTSLTVRLHARTAHRQSLFSDAKTELRAKPQELCRTKFKGGAPKAMPSNKGKRNALRPCMRPAGLEITHIALQNGSPSGAPVTYFFKVPRIPGLGLSATKGASAAC